AAPVYVETAGAANPLAAVNVGADSTASFADIDGDGDLDAIVGAADGTLSFFENTGTTAAPVYVQRTGSANPFDAIDVGSGSTPSFADMDSDGDLDVIVGDAGGTFTYLLNTGTTLAPVYVERTTAGDNLILAGVGADTVITGGGTDLVMGDNGEFNWGATGLLESFMSTDPILGADDVILVGDGDNIVVGGFGSDTITSGSGTDILLGDNGAVTYTPLTTQLLQAVSTDAVNGTGGNDIITAGEGDNLLLAGVGDDTVTAGTGADLVMGDNGQIDWTASGVYDSFQTTDPTLGGNDDIRVGDGDNIVLGGFGSDVIETGVGTDLIIGDNGLFDFTEVAGVAVLIEASTTDTTALTGAGDVIVSGGGSGTNIVLAGLGDDRVNQPPLAPTDPLPAVSTGVDIVIGDNGFVNWDTGAQLTQFGSTEPELGGDDLIDVGDGGNIVIGGFGDDAITTGIDADIVLGDDGQVDYVGTDLDSTDIDLIQSTSTDAFGGVDTIITSGGNDIVIGGRFGDVIDAGDGSNLVIGDSGQITSDVVDAPQLAGLPITLGLIETIQLDDGGADLLTTGSGSDIIMAGFGSDTIGSGSDNDIVLGDNGLIAYQNAVISQIESTDTVAGTGGDDIIDAGEGSNVVIGGVGSDILTTGSGSDVVTGDNGTVIYDAAGVLVQVVSGDPLLGGSDTISTGDGVDVAIGGAQGDTVTSAGGSDVLFGDGGMVTFVAAGPQLLIESIDVNYGGNDTLDAGAGNDILIGGQGDDLIYGTLTEDLLFGGSAAVTLVAGIIVSIETDLNDLVSASLFKSFGALQGLSDDAIAGLLDLLPGHQAEVRELLAKIIAIEPLLDPNVFQKLFKLGVFSLPAGPISVSLFQQVFGTVVVTMLAAPTHGESGERAGANSAGPTDAAAGSAATVLAAPDATADATDSRSDVLALLGIAGLHAVQSPQSRA
ncbi:FG-GAP-like repeat-containing protein, partial [Zavarzinia sp.]|uniref:FG-GAP-like repeat-containing protein n=1 Tax=Zavarzinia sp. TaxID=2027920 RepID=UPI00356A7523